MDIKLIKAIVLNIRSKVVITKMIYSFVKVVNQVMSLTLNMVCVDISFLIVNLTTRTIFVPLATMILILLW